MSEASAGRALQVQEACVVIRLWALLDRRSRQRGAARVRLALVLLAGGAAGSAAAATFTVTNAGDASGTTCAAQCSLRQAIGAANLTATADTVAFNIPGTGPHTIALGSLLTDVLQPLTIDGYTQPGAAPNTLAEGDNAVIRIRLDGAGLPSGSDGLFICAPDSLVRGLSTTNFSRFDFALGQTNTGGACATNATNITLQGNFVGLHPSGSTRAASNFGIRVAGTAAGAVIGGAAPAERNLIVANDTGLNLSIDLAQVNGNYFGTDASGLLDRGGTGDAIFLVSAANNSQIGTLAPNLFAHYQNAITAASGSTNTRAFANHFFDLSSIGIDLIASGASPDGITANDANDVDSGANNLQNFPENIAISRTANGLSISGRVDRPATAAVITFTIGVYVNPDCSAQTDREGARFLGSFPFVSVNQSSETFTNVAVSTGAALPIGAGVTLTATDPNGNTSEFSTCTNIDAASPVLTVTKIADTNDGACNADCSLREAMTAANANANGSVIAFNIPGAGPHTIAPTTALPTISNPVLIDGYTQPGASANTDPVTSNATIMIGVDGNGIAGTRVAFGICSNNSTIRGLSLTRFTVGASVGLTNVGDVCGATLRNNTIAGNFFSLAADGGTRLANTANNLTVNSATGTTVGGDTPAERNVFAGSQGDTIELQGSTLAGTSIDGNMFGTDRSGTLDLASSGTALDLSDNTAFSDVEVGSRQRNFLRFHGRAIVIGSAQTGVAVYANDISDSDALGIDLVAVGNAPDGQTPNDVNDGDSGANGLQNFPVIASASALGGILTLSGTLDSPVGSSRIIRLAAYENLVCDTGGRGEGRLYLGSAFALITGAAEGFQIQLPNAPAVGRIVTMTATDDAGNTSEFSACATVTDGEQVFANGFE